MNLKGSLPLLILHVLENQPNHGYGIARLIRDRSDGFLDFKEGTLYPTLHGMEKRGVIETFEQEDGRRLRRYYRLTHTGRAELESARAEWSRYANAVNAVLKGSAI